MIGQSNRYLHESSIPIITFLFDYKMFTQHILVSKKFTAIFVFVIEQCFATIPKKKKNLLEIPWNPKGAILRPLAPHSHMGFHHFWSQYIWERLVPKGGTTTFRIVVLFIILTFFDY